MRGCPPLSTPRLGFIPSGVFRELDEFYLKFFALMVTWARQSDKGIYYLGVFFYGFACVLLF